jgi:quercetin dioxygenase-like cupin family protein
MRKSIGSALTITALLATLPAAAQEGGVAKPELLLQQVIEGMPRGETQEVRVLAATLKPGDRTGFHTHRSPVTIYVLEGAFTLEMEGHQPMTVKAGEAMIEPPSVQMTGFNRSMTEPMKVLIFYVSDPGTPFLDPIQ